MSHHASIKPPLPATLRVLLLVDKLPECLLPCAECREMFVPGSSSFWLEEYSIRDAGVRPFCSEECMYGFQVREALATHTHTHSNSTLNSGTYFSTR